MSETELREVLDAYCRAVGPAVYQLSTRRRAGSEQGANVREYEARVEFHHNDKAKDSTLATYASTVSEAFYQMAYFVLKQQHKLKLPRSMPALDVFRNWVRGQFFSREEADRLLSEIRLEVFARTRF